MLVKVNHPLHKTGRLSFYMYKGPRPATYDIAAVKILPKRDGLHGMSDIA